MPSALRVASPFHAGEQAVQERLGVREKIEPWARKVVRPELSPELRDFFEKLPFLVAAARDADGRPWATILAGAPGFVHAQDPKTLRIASDPAPGDALHGALQPGVDVGLLGIELATRRRNRVNGRVRSTADGALLFEVDQSFGNCPQYIVERAWQRASPAQAPAAGERHARLSAALAARIRRADTFFIATGTRRAEALPSGGDASHAEPAPADPTQGMDASHRGGAPGFVEVADDRTLVIPDYAGNNHFNTIGNLVLDPRAGLLFVDFEHAGLLQLTGATQIDWDSPALARHPGARRLIRFRLDEAVWQADALPIRWAPAAGSERSLRLVARRRESDDVVSFHFAARDGGALPDFAAGQHLPIALDLPGQKEPVVRSYSLSNGPGRGGYRISVKREPKGLASRHLHDALEVGAILSARAPAGDFVLAGGTRPVFLVSAGIGVTPLLAMLHALVESADPRPVWFVHGARDGRHHPLASEVGALAARSDRVTTHVAYSRPLAGDRGFDRAGRVDAALLAGLRPQLDADYYLCGPPGFMAAIQTALEDRGVPVDRIRSESFGPLG